MILWPGGTETGLPSYRLPISVPPLQLSVCLCLCVCVSVSVCLFVCVSVSVYQSVLKDIELRGKNNEIRFDYSYTYLASLLNNNILNINIRLVSLFKVSDI